MSVISCRRRRFSGVAASCSVGGDGRKSCEIELRHLAAAAKAKDLRLQVRNEEKPARRAAAPASLHVVA